MRTAAEVAVSWPRRAAAFTFVFILCGCTSAPKEKMLNKISIKNVGAVTESNFESLVERSTKIILDFSKDYGLGISDPHEFVLTAIQYGSKSDFDKMIQSSPGWPKNQAVPQSYVGVGQNKIFHVVAWDSYKSIHPEDTLDDYQKLIVHELTHLFHVAYLHDQENRMGPVWFYEGFACLVADQYLDAPMPSHDKITSIVADPNRGNYRSYAPILRALSKSKSIRYLLDHADNKDFGTRMEQVLVR